MLRVVGTKRFACGIAIRSSVIIYCHHMHPLLTMLRLARTARNSRTSALRGHFVYGIFCRFNELTRGVRIATQPTFTRHRTSRSLRLQQYLISVFQGESCHLHRGGPHMVGFQERSNNTNRERIRNAGHACSATDLPAAINFRLVMWSRAFFKWGEARSTFTYHCFGETLSFTKNPCSR